MPEPYRIKDNQKKIISISLNTLPIIIMIALIPDIKNDYLLAGAYILIIAVSFLVKYERRDLLFLAFGFLAMTAAEFFFVSTGVETFARQSLFGIMPVWLPVLWAYAFVAMRRAIVILDK